MAPAASIVSAAVSKPSCVLVVLCGCALLPGCVSWFFSGLPKVDRSRPVALLETTGGVECAATTELGILSLGRSATSGPCRVHYFLGPTPMIEDGKMTATGTAFYRADMDLKTQAVRVLARSVEPTDHLVAMYTLDGNDVVTVAVALARGEGLEGDLLADPGQRLPAGAAVLARNDEGLWFCGLISGRVTRSDSAASWYTFAGPDRIRELLAIPVDSHADVRFRHRVDDITVPDVRR
jgi:hypothetical protein